MFKIGDVVECLNDHEGLGEPSHYLKGHTYVVKEHRYVNGPCPVVMTEMDEQGRTDNGWNADNFKLKEPEVKTMKFEVGKQYINNNHPQAKHKSHVFIGYKTDGFRVWENEKGLLWLEKHLTTWQEYIPPVTHTRYVHWVRYPAGQIGSFISTSPEFGREYGTLIKTDKVTYVESKETVE